MSEQASVQMRMDLGLRPGNSFLSGTNWVGLADFDTLIDTLPKTPGISVMLDEFKVRRLTAGDDIIRLTDKAKAEIVLAGDSESRRYRGGESANDGKWSRVA